jgi:hypothetical protein
MGFMFRVEQVTVSEGETVLTGHMISGALDWRQQVEIQINEDMKTVFTASLRGVASTEHAGLTLFDPASWENVLTLPLSINREKRIGLILHGMLPADLPVPAIAVGVDSPMPASTRGLQTAFQSADLPASIAAKVGVPVSEYSYRISRRGMFYFAPWSLLFLALLLSCVYVGGLFSGLHLQRISFEKLVGYSLFGLIDVLFLYLSIKMLLAKPSQIVVTTAGIVMPVILPGFSSNVVYVSFGEMDEMLECWHNGAVEMVKLKTARRILHLNAFLMQATDFEELRRLLWRRIHDNRLHQDPLPALGLPR